MTAKKLAILLAAALILTSCAFALPAAAQELRVDFYDVGKADAMLITAPGGERILIDAATNKGGSTLVDRFEKEGIDHIDVMLITHFDKDHVGGADKILENISVDRVIMPVYDKESKQLTQFMEALEESRVKDVTRMKIGSTTAFDLPGGVSLNITAAHEPYYGSDEENDFSLAVRMTYGDTRFFFAGDAEAPRQIELLEEGSVACDVLKVPYHGRLVSVSEQFLSEANPKIAYITDDEEDPANKKVISILEKLGAQVFTSLEDGSITVISDGSTVSTR